MQYFGALIRRSERRQRCGLNASFARGKQSDIPPRIARFALLAETCYFCSNSVKRSRLGGLSGGRAGSVAMVVRKVSMN